MTSFWTAIILQIVLVVSKNRESHIEVQIKEKASKINVLSLYSASVIERKNVAGPTKIGDRCQANTDVCQESFNYALCINEKCQCITGYHFVNETKACVQSRGIHSHFFFSRRKIID